MKKLSLILFTLCLLFCHNLFAQSDLQTGSTVLSSFSTGDLPLTKSIAGQPLTETAYNPAAGFLFPRDREYYLRKSKKQKRTGLILLGTGVALIGTSIIVAHAHDDDAIAAGVSLVFLGGPGFITSLVSIPFFVASARNKRKANSITSSVQLLQHPVLSQTGLGYKPYPALAVKMQF